MAGKPIAVAIKFNGVTEITLTPTEPNDKALLGIAAREKTVTKIDILDDGAVRFTLAPEVPAA